MGSGVYATTYRRGRGRKGWRRGDVDWGSTYNVRVPQCLLQWLTQEHTVNHIAIGYKGDDGHCRHDELLVVSHFDVFFPKNSLSTTPSSHCTFLSVGGFFRRSTSTWAGQGRVKWARQGFKTTQRPPL